MNSLMIKINNNLIDICEKHRLLNYYNNLLIEEDSIEYITHLNIYYELINKYSVNLDEINSIINNLELKYKEFYSNKLEYLKDFYKRYYEVVIEVDNASMLINHLNKMNVFDNDILRITINKYIHSTNYKLVLFIDELKSIEHFINCLKNTII